MGKYFDYRVLSAAINNQAYLERQGLPRSDIGGLIQHHHMVRIGEDKRVCKGSNLHPLVIMGKNNTSKKGPPYFACLQTKSYSFFLGNDLSE